TEIVSAELKIDGTGLIVAFGQACSYKLFSHKSYIVVPSQSQEEDIGRLDVLCRTIGLGLILFDADKPCIAPGFLDTERGLNGDRLRARLRPVTSQNRRFREYPDSGPPPQVVSVSLYGPRFSASTPSPWSGGPPQRIGPRLRRCPMAEALDQPLGVVTGDEGADDLLRLLEARELVQVDALLLERAHEALGDAVALRFPDVRRRDRAPQPLHFVDPGVGDVLRAPVTPDGQTARHVLTEPAEGVVDALANRLERRPPIPELRGVPTHDFVEMVIDRPAKPAPALPLGVEPCRIGAPHPVGSIGDDRAVVRRVAIRRAQPTRRQQPVAAHEPQHALPAQGQPPVGQARPDLPIAFPVEGAGSEHGTDRLDHLGIALPRLRPRLVRRPHDSRRSDRRIHARAGHPIHLADHGQRIRPLRARAHPAFHRPRLFHPALKPLFSMRASPNSNLIINPPILARASVSSRSSGSPRIRKPRVPCSRNTRFQLSSSCAGTWLSRETASSASPRRSRNTSSIFRD